MLPELNRLIDLQEIDKLILEVTEDLARLPRELEEQSLRLEELQTEQAGLLQERESLQKQRRELEGEISSLEAGIKSSRQRLMQIKSNLEYRAMLKEIAFKEDQRDQKETQVLELLDQIEAKSQAIALQDQRLKELEQFLRRRQGEIQAEIRSLKDKLAGLEERRQLLRQELPPMLLQRYEFIRQRYNSTTVTEVRQGVCLGCHMNILPQQYIDLQKGLEILQCPHCQRILYWLGEEEEEEPAPPKRASRKASAS